MQNILGVIYSFVYIGVILLISTRLTKLPYEISRKFIHIMVANWWFIASAMFHDPFSASIVPLVFVVFNTVSYYFNFLPSMNVQIGYKDYGTIYYALSVLFLTFISFQSNSSLVIGGIGLLTMGYGDGFASLIGRKWGKHQFKIFNGVKSLEGSAAMLIVSFAVVYAYLIFATGHAGFVVCLTIAFTATLVEAISPFGLDNILVPVIAAMVYFVQLL